MRWVRVRARCGMFLTPGFMRGLFFQNETMRPPAAVQWSAVLGAAWFLPLAGARPHVLFAAFDDVGFGDVSYLQSPGGAEFQTPGKTTASHRCRHTAPPAMRPGDPQPPGCLPATQLASRSCSLPTLPALIALFDPRSMQACFCCFCFCFCCCCCVCCCGCCYCCCCG